MTKHFWSNREKMYHYAASDDYDGSCIRSSNSSVYDGEVYSYAELIAKFNKDTEKMIYTGHYYSSTTSNSMSELRRAFDHYRRLMVYDFTVEEGVIRLKRQLELHQKEPATRKPDKEYFINSVYSLENLVEYYGKGKKYLNMSFYNKAKAIADKYHEEIAAKEKRAEERRAIKAAAEEKERQERLDRTLSICKEYDPLFDAEPTTFRECMEKKNIHIPFEWLEEHHPECIAYEYGGKINCRVVNLNRSYDYENNKWKDYVEFTADCDNYKLLRNICRYGGNGVYSPDILVYHKDMKLLSTNRYCNVYDTAGHVKTLLGLFLQAIDAGKDVSFVIGKHCGPYEIREYNAAEKFLRVGCHCFLLENLREVYADMKGE